MCLIKEDLVRTVALALVAGLLAIIPGANNHPLNGGGKRIKREEDEEPNTHAMGVSFLQSFGYFPKSDLETGALRSEEEFRKAIKAMQRFAKLPETGELDTRTVEKMRSPRCGLPDKTDNEGWSRRRRKKRYKHSSEKWQKQHLTYRFLNYTPKLKRGEQEDAIMRAFRVWSDVTNLDFSKISTAEFSDIYIQFAEGYHQDGYPFDGQGMVLAHAFFPGTDDRAGDTHFDNEEMWTIGTDDGINLFSVAAHEFGHALGLAHSDVIGSLMYPWYAGYVPDFTLHPDDVAGIQALYGVRYSGKLPPITPRVPVIVPTRGPVPTKRPTTRATTRRPYRPRPTTPPPPPTVRPHTTTIPPADRRPVTCDTDIDALANIRGEVIIFKGKWFWRRNSEGVLPGFPILISEFWIGYPKDQHVDAVYERSYDGKIVFFYGPRYWLFNGNHMIGGFPRYGRLISEIGIPNHVMHIDAAFEWGYNNKVYLISGNEYWRMSTRRFEVDHGYSRDMSIWGGVPLPVDAAFQFWDGRTYFFKGRSYWEFNDGQMHVRDNYPKLLAGMWMGCAIKDAQDGETNYPRVEGNGANDRPTTNNANSPNIKIGCGYRTLPFLYMITFFTIVLAKRFCIYDIS